MGAIKLRETALKDYGVSLTAAQAERFKDGWRGSNRHIVKFWDEMERGREAGDPAAAAAVFAGRRVGGGVHLHRRGRSRCDCRRGGCSTTTSPRIDRDDRVARLLGRRSRRPLGRAADMGRQARGERHAGGGARHHVGGDAAGVAAERAGAVHDGARRTGLRADTNAARPVQVYCRN